MEARGVAFAHRPLDLTAANQVTNSREMPADKMLDEPFATRRRLIAFGGQDPVDLRLARGHPHERVAQIGTRIPGPALRRLVAIFPHHAPTFGNRLHDRSYPTQALV